MWNNIGVLTVCGQCHILSVGVKNNIKLLAGGLTTKGVNSRGDLFLSAGSINHLRVVQELNITMSSNLRDS